MQTASAAIRFRSMAPRTFLLISSSRIFSTLRIFPLTLIGHDKVSTLRRQCLEDHMERVFKYPKLFRILWPTISLILGRARLVATLAFSYMLAEVFQVMGWSLLRK